MKLFALDVVFLCILNGGEKMASKRQVRRSECGNKKKFDTFEEAGRSSKISSMITKRRIMAYKCKWCGGFHIGHPPKKVKQRVYQERMAKYR